METKSAQLSCKYVSNSSTFDERQMNCIMSFNFTRRSFDSITQLILNLAYNLEVASLSSVPGTLE